jgi:hypothetical protein
VSLDREDRLILWSWVIMAVALCAWFLWGSASHAATYSRSEFGRGWIDADGDCQDTRQEVLIEESLVPVELSGDGCRVVLGLWLCPYTGKTFTDPGQLDVDHMVPLKAAWEAGAWSWPKYKRILYANDLIDPNHLIAVEAGANRQKGAQGPQTWLPRVEYVPAYVENWNAICSRWRLDCEVP